MIDIVFVFFKLRQQLDDTRRVLSTTKTQHVLQLEQVEVHFVKILTLYFVCVT